MNKKVSPAIFAAVLVVLLAVCGFIYTRIPIEQPPGKASSGKIVDNEMAKHLKQKSAALREQADAAKAKANGSRPADMPKGDAVNQTDTGAASPKHPLK